MTVTRNDTAAVGWNEGDGSGGGGSTGGSSSTATVIASVAGVVTIDCSAGDYFRLVLTEDITDFDITGLPGVGLGASKWVRIIQGAGPFSITWPASFKWRSANTLSPVAGDVDNLAITTVDNGVIWDADLGKDYG